LAVTIAINAANKQKTNAVLMLKGFEKKKKKV